MRRAASLVLIFTVIGAVVLVFYLSSKRQHQPIVDNRLELRKLIAEQEVESAQAVAEYQPTVQHRMDDLNVSVADLLRGLPGVSQVEVGVEVRNPVRRIIHLRGNRSRLGIENHYYDSYDEPEPEQE
jgi:hypothetical protein